MKGDRAEQNLFSLNDCYDLARKTVVIKRGIIRRHYRKALIVTKHFTGPGEVVFVLLTAPSF